MKPWMKILGLLLCLCMACSLWACNSDSEETTPTVTGPSVPSEPSVPPTETTVAPTEPDPLTLYESACQALSSQANLVIRYDYAQERTVDNQTYTETSTGSASYKGLGTEEMEALISEKLSFCGYDTEYIRSYIAGSGYCRVDNYNFSCEMTGEEFIDRELPAILVDGSLYETLERSDNEDGTYTLTFTNPAALEGWVDETGAAKLSSAQAIVTMSSVDALVGAQYWAEYTVSNVAYTVRVSITVETPAELDFSAQQPVYPDDCAALNDLSIPLRMLQVVGDLYATERISASYTDSLYSAAFAVIRSQTGSFDTWGRDEEFMCAMDTQVTVTDYAGNSTANSQTITYRDGVYNYATNGGEMKEAEGVTAEDVRISCEDAILSSLFELGHISSATLKDTGDFLRIQFEANEEITQELCNSIYALFSMDLDTYADSYTTEAAGGYLYINKYTGLPTSLGMNLERTHTIAGASYPLTYQLDQSMELPSGSAYTNITGQPENTARSPEGATPLFYKVTGKNGETMWLLGTIHAGDHRTGNLPAQITKAFWSSDALAVEFNTKAFEESLATDATLLSQLTQAYYYSDGSKYSDHLSKSVRSQLKQLIYASGNNNINAPYMKVGIWSSVVESFYMQQGSNLSADLGMDTRLMSWAQAQEMPIYEIESGLFQIQLISGFSDELQVKLLEDTLETGMLRYNEELQALYELWCQGDEAALTAYFETDTSEMSKAEKKLYKEYYKAMTTSRNKTMHKAAVDYLSSGETVFYAVGLAHLLGEDGLVASLREAGYTVELVAYE